MTALLHWALEHSDGERLKELMKKYQDNNLTIYDVYGKDVINSLFVNEGQVMMEHIKCIEDFKNESMSDDVLEASLEQLQELVEQVDNAANLHRMGGLRPLLELCVADAHRPEGTRALALWTLGVAASNNEPVQVDLMSLDALRVLAARLGGCGGDGAGAHYCGKLVYALGALVRNSAATQAAADELGVLEWLLRVGSQHSSAGIAKKSMGLLDTVLAQFPEARLLDALPAAQDAVAAGILAHVRGGGASSGDVDAAEKALRLLDRLLSLRPLLFAPSFQQELAAAAGVLMGRCEEVYGAGDELCEGLLALAGRVDAALAARAVADDEL